MHFCFFFALYLFWSLVHSVIKTNRIFRSHVFVFAQCFIGTVFLLGWFRYSAVNVCCMQFFLCLRVCDCSLTTCNVSYSQKENQSHTKHILMGYISPTKLNKHTGNSVLVCVCELFRTKFSFCDKNAFAGRLFIIRNATIQ